VETEEFKQFLDYIPIAIVVSKFFRGDRRICYANKTFETLTGHATQDCGGRGWSILAAFRDENDLKATLEQAMLKGGEEFLGTFRREEPVTLVEAFSGLIENEDGTENYRIAALIDVTTRARGAGRICSPNSRQGYSAERAATPCEEQSPIDSRAYSS
jgi:PAS domain S-box-containing protein